jgi:hypothetical protein
MLALRNIVCSDRWAEAWQPIVSTLRQQAKQRRTERRHQRRAAQRQPPYLTPVGRQRPNPPCHPPQRNQGNLGVHRPIIPGGVCRLDGRVSGRRVSTPMQNREPHPISSSMLTGSLTRLTIMSCP